MPRPTALFFALCAALTILAGCASKATMDARYDASLQRWKGATRAELEAAWGPPRLAQAAGGDTVLTWIVRTDIDDRADLPVYVAATTGSRSSVTVGPTTSIGAAVPITCTTHFVLKDGRVAAWTFEGLGCGAPT